MSINYNDILQSKTAVFFDLDGTVVDSMGIWREIDIEYLAGIGYELPDDLQKCIEGMSFTETAVYFKDRFKIKDDLETIKGIWNQMAYDKYTKEVSLKPGVKAFLKRLKEDKVKTGIASSNSLELITGVLKANGIYDLFDVITTSCEAGAGKPAPDIYLLSANKVGAKPENCLVFEDIVLGIMAGKSAGMSTIAVYDDYSKDTDNEKAELADYYIVDFTEII